MVPRSGRKLPVLCLAVAFVAVPALAAGAHHHFSVKIGSVNSAGVKGNDYSSTEGTQELSQNGRLYVFTSQATNLPHGDGTNYQGYLHDFKTGKTKLISTSSAGVAAGGYVNYPEISADGRIVTFDGLATGLPGAGPENEVWAKDLKTGKTVLVSQTSQGDPASGDGSYLATPSADGRFVAFESRADNLPGGDGVNGYVYVRDLKKGKTILASRNSAGDPVTGHPYGQSLSGNGRSLVFSSDDTALPNGADSFDHVYVRNLDNGKTKQVDVLSNGTSADDQSRTPSLSQNGRFVAYDSRATNFPGGVTFGGYVLDRITGKTRLVTRLSNGTPAEGSNVRISADGSIVVFESEDATLTHGDGIRYEVFARNLKTGKTTMLSRTRKGHPGNGDSYYSSLSENGRFASFEGYAVNLGGDASFSQGFRAGPIH